MTTIIKDETLTAIGDAIREKTGKTNKLTPAEMATEIAGITTGSGGDPIVELFDDEIVDFKNDNLTTLPESAFRSREKLVTVNCKNVTKLGRYVFYECPNLTTVSLPKMQTVDIMCFFHDANLTTVKGFENLVTIGNQAFAYCKKFEFNKFGRLTKTIDAYAFNYCHALKKLFIPSTLTTIRSNVFDSCNALTDVYTDAAEKPSDWYATAFPSTTTIHYGVTEAEFDEILVAGGTE